MSDEHQPGRLRRALAGLVESPVVPVSIENRVKSRRMRSRRRPGGPDSLPQSLFAEMSSRRWGLELAGLSHTPISTWKGTSASFVWLEFRDGTERRIVTKTARAGGRPHGVDQFPVEPGKPELWVYGIASKDLTEILPECFLATSPTGPESYVLMLEDLSSEFLKPPRIVGWMSGLRGVSIVHTALGHAADRHGTSDLLRYDRRFREDLVEFVHRAVSRFQVLTGERAARDLTGQWHNVQRAYLSPRFEVPGLSRPIHGDFNTGNVFVSRSPGHSLKAVDWEWTGIGLPHVDYASYVKRAPDGVFDLAVQELVRSYPALPAVEHDLLLRHSLLERSIWDAALLANQAEMDGRLERLTPGVRRSLEKATTVLPELVTAT